MRDEFIHSLLEGATLGETTMLVSSHDIPEVERLCDRVALLDSGRLQLDEFTDELQARFRRIEFTLSDVRGKTGIKSAASLRSATEGVAA